MKRRVLVSMIALIAIAAAGAGTFLISQDKPEAKGADPRNLEQVALGRTVYAENCAACHGANLEGQPDWRKRKPDGRLPAPPHDRTGHTWEHPDEVLFRVTKEGFQTYAGPNYQTDMPGFGLALSDREIWSVLAFIKSQWPPYLLERQQRVQAPTYARTHDQHTAKPAASSTAP